VVKRDREEALHDPEPGRGPELSAAQQQAIDDLHAAAAAGQIALDETESKSLLRPFGLALPREMVARTVEEGIEAAARIGYPVVIKAVSPELLHKTEAGAVILDIKDAEEFRSAWAALHDNVARSQKTSGIDCVLIAEMVQQGVEFVLGAHHDPEAGMVVMAGAGGVFVELLKDVQLAAPPLTERKARQMLRSLRASRLLDGFRGNAKLDDQPIVDALLALSRLIEAAGDHIQSVDINPFVITASRGVALDALVILRGGNGEKQGGQAGPVTHRRDLQEAQ
jgi:acyl-CoA synthetase (NDP forming)